VFGIQGELKCDPTSAGRTLFVAGEELHYAFPSSTLQRKTVRVQHIREHKGRLLLHLEGIDSVVEAQKMVGVTFYAPRESIELDENEYLDEDLIGCTVFSIRGEELGAVMDVHHYPASDMLIVHNRMIPLIRAFVREIDIAKKRIVMDLPEGLLDDSAMNSSD